MAFDAVERNVRRKIHEKRIYRDTRTRKENEMGEKQIAKISTNGFQAYHNNDNTLNIPLPGHHHHLSSNLPNKW